MIYISDQVVLLAKKLNGNNILDKEIVQNNDH